jgi:hypothetical protein
LGREHARQLSRVTFGYLSQRASARVLVRVLDVGGGELGPAGLQLHERVGEWRPTNRASPTMRPMRTDSSRGRHSGSRPLAPYRQADKGLQLYVLSR